MGSLSKLEINKDILNALDMPHMIYSIKEFKKNIYTKFKITPYNTIIYLNPELKKILNLNINHINVDVFINYVTLFFVNNKPSVFCYEYNQKPVDIFSL